MLKTLVKKQLLEAFRRSSKKKKAYKGASTIILVAFLLIVLMFSFGSIAYFLGESLIPMGMSALYFTLFFVIAILLGVVGSVFHTYTAVFKAKDNDALLSLPIKPFNIVIARLIGVFATGLLYASAVYVPAAALYFYFGHPDVLSVIFCILGLPLIGLLIMAISSFMGWLVALISTKLNNKTFISVALYLIFFILYYMMVSRMDEYMQYIITNSDQVSGTLQAIFYPIYQLAKGVSGDIIGMLIFTAIAFALTVLTLFFITKSFNKITTTTTTNTKTKVKEAVVTSSSVSKTLLKKEFKRLTGSIAYMLNCALGTFFTPILVVVLLINQGYIKDLMVQLSFIDNPEGYIAVILLGSSLTLCSMNTLTAPSISLEGQSLWIIKTIPVSPMEIYKSKLKMHLILTAPVVFVSMTVITIVIGLDPLVSVMLIASTQIFVVFHALAGLCLNIRKPRFDWINETAAVKQSFPTFVEIFGGMALTAVIIGAYMLIPFEINVYLYIGAFLILAVIFTLLLWKWLKGSGCRRFAKF